jgi:RNA polymerase sigma-70 factor (ECF subfamily)
LAEREPDFAAVIPRLRRYARVLVHDAQLADDLVQDTLVRGWEKRHLWAPDTDLRAWLFTVMHNLHVNQVSARLRQGATESLDADDGARPAREIAVRAQQSDRLEVADLWRQLARLPAEQREVLLLVAIEELRYEQVARVLQVPVGTVMSRLSRARERLRRYLADSPGPGSGLRAVT